MQRDVIFDVIMYQNKELLPQNLQLDEHRKDIYVALVMHTKVMYSFRKTRIDFANVRKLLPRFKAR